MELYEYTAYELSQMLRDGICSAAEIAESISSRISEAEKTTGAYITINEEMLSSAKSVDKAMADGMELHPLAGIPVAVKDNISTKGMRTTCASKMLENYIPPFDAEAVSRMKTAGMLITGKTNMDEFAMGSSTDNSFMHITRNPRNTSYAAGGSSGGSAVAVSSGEAVLALGTDTGGSVRQPSAFCGIVGIKPTYGSTSRYGLIAYASSLEQIGAMGRTVRDTAMLQSLISGYDAKDATTVCRESVSYAEHLCSDAAGLRIGVPAEFFGDDISDDVKCAVVNAVRELEKRGARVKHIELPMTKYAVNAYYITASAEASSNLARYDGIKYGYRAERYTDLNDMYRKTRSEGFGKEVKRRIMLGTYVLSEGHCEEYYQKALRVRKKICSEIKQAFSECDIIAAPTAPTAAFRTGAFETDAISMYKSDICTVTANIAGIPSISVPCGMNSEGLPYGLQLMGNHFCEQTVFNAAYAYEQIRGGFDRPVRHIGGSAE